MSGRGLLVSPGDEVLFVTANGKVERIAVDDVPIMGRATQGAQLMKVAPGDRIVAATVIRKEQS